MKLKAHLPLLKNRPETKLYMDIEKCLPSEILFDPKCSLKHLSLRPDVHLAQILSCDQLLSWKVQGEFSMILYTGIYGLSDNEPRDMERQRIHDLFLKAMNLYWGKFLLKREQEFESFSLLSHPHPISSKKLLYLSSTLEEYQHKYHTLSITQKSRLYIENRSFNCHSFGLVKLYSPIGHA